MVHTARNVRYKYFPNCFNCYLYILFLLFYIFFRYFAVEIIPQEGYTSITEPFQLKEYDVYQAVISITEQIHGEFGAAAVKSGLDGKIIYI